MQWLCFCCIRLRKLRALNLAGAACSCLWIVMMSLNLLSFSATLSLSLMILARTLGLSEVSSEGPDTNCFCSLVSKCMDYLAIYCIFRYCIKMLWYELNYIPTSLAKLWILLHMVSWTNFLINWTFLSVFLIAGCPKCSAALWMLYYFWTWKTNQIIEFTYCLSVWKQAFTSCKFVQQFCIFEVVLDVNTLFFEIWHFLRKYESHRAQHTTSLYMVLLLMCVLLCWNAWQMTKDSISCPPRGGIFICHNCSSIIVTSFAN